MGQARTPSAEEAVTTDGALAIVLHSHMPYVEGFGTYPFGEEWLFDAVLRSYLPVLEVADRLTMTVTPVLADQLEAPGASERLVEFGREFRLGSSLLDAEEEGEDLRAPCLAEADRYRRGLAQLEELGGPLEAFRRASAEGRVSLMTSAATHAVLPLVATSAGRRLQLDAGLRSHRRRFGEPDGLWLPECAYSPGLEDAVAEFGFTHFCVDQSAHEDPAAALRPIATGGPVAFPIDWEAISWLWSLDGYPSDPVHTDFHRESLRGARPWSIGGGVRDPAEGAARAREQAREFLRAVRERLATHRERSGAPGLLTFAIDTELLGHWWWEGPEWLAEVVSAAEAEGVELITLADAVNRFEPEEGRPIATSSWGEHKDLSTWDSPAVADLAWGARRLELRLLREMDTLAGEPARAERAARELLALQASDWAFLDKRRQAGDYPYTRVTTHARALLDAINCARAPEARLRGLAPDLSLAPLLEP